MRRFVIGGVMFEIALLIVGLTWIVPLAHRDDGRTAGEQPTASQEAPADSVFQVQSQGTGDVVEVNLVAEETVQTIAEGVDYRVWTFNGTAPGPVIRVKLGDTVRFTLTNNSSEGLAHSIDFHAAQTPWDKNYQPVQPGETFTFDWVARFPGVFMYHCGVPPVLHHIANGMYGAIVVEPEEGLEPAREFVLVSSEFYAADEPNADGVYEGDVAKMEDVDPSQVVFDGMANRYLTSPLQARPNELVRIWVMNAGPTLTNAFHVIGALFDHVHPDGNPTTVLNGVQTYNVPPGGGAMFELRVPDEGMYPFVTHSFAYTGLGSVGVLQVTSEAPPAPAAYPAYGDPFTGGVLEYGSTPTVVEGADQGDTPSDGPISMQAAITGFTPADIEVMEGEVDLEVENLDAFQHDLTIDELDVQIPFAANETVEGTFHATPGTYTFYCSIPGHREAGMEGTLTVLPGAGH